MFPPKSLSIQRFRKSKIYQLRGCPGQCLGIFRLARSRTNGPSNGALKISKVFLACLDFNGSIVIWANSDYQKWYYMCFCQTVKWLDGTKGAMRTGGDVVSLWYQLMHDFCIFQGTKKLDSINSNQFWKEHIFKGKVKAWFQLKYPP